MFLEITTPGPIQQSFAEGDVVGQRRVDAEKAILSDVAKSGDPRYSRDKDIVPLVGVMTDLVAGPQHDVVAEVRKPE